MGERAGRSPSPHRGRGKSARHPGGGVRSIRNGDVQRLRRQRQLLVRRLRVGWPFVPLGVRPAHGRKRSVPPLRQRWPVRGVPAASPLRPPPPQPPRRAIAIRYAIKQAAGQGAMAHGHGKSSLQMKTHIRKARSYTQSAPVAQVWVGGRRKARGCPSCAFLERRVAAATRRHIILRNLWHETAP